MESAAPDVRPGNHLVLDSAIGNTRLSRWTDHLRGHSPDTARLLAITFSYTPDEIVDAIKGEKGLQYEEIYVISAGATTRSRSGRASVVEIDGATVTIDTIESPSNLTEFGVAVTTALDQWNRTDDPIVVGVHSLTVLLQYLDLDQVFRFLHVLTAEFRSNGCTAFFHLDPNAHDDIVFHKLKPLFDTTSSAPGEDGGHTDDREPSIDDGSGDVMTEVGADQSRFETQIASDETPTGAVLRAIAAIEGVEEVDLDSPIYDWIDPDALDSLLTHTNEPPDTDLHVAFTYDGHQVIVGTENITVRANLD